MKTFRHPVVIFVLLECIFILLYINGRHTHRAGTILLFRAENFFLLIAVVLWLVNRGAKKG